MSVVLIVDDEPQIRHALVVNLGVRGYAVLEAADGESGLQRIAAQRPDLVLLDLGLPNVDGLEVLQALRRWSDVPVIVLTARDDERMKVRALDAGADDYVTKPFGMSELLARLRATLRRATTYVEGDPVLATDWFTVDLTTHVASAGEPRRPVALTRTEWAIVEHLARHPGRLVTYRQLIDQVWGEGSTVQPRLIRVHLASIRHKLERDPSRPEHFLTDSGIGVRLAEPAVATS
jgi:two-component system KDP operon response regulator KdpE